MKKRNRCRHLFFIFSTRKEKRISRRDKPIEIDLDDNIKEARVNNPPVLMNPK
jgi:hypothetical protein